MNGKSVDIITPVYNVEPFIFDFLNSITAQTYTNFQVICVDDGSTDNCGEILDKHVTKDARFYVIHQKNKGYNAAVNTGLSQANGDYISFIDPDDFVEPDFLEKMVITAERTKADIVITNFFRDKKNNRSPMENRKTVQSEFSDNNLAFIYGFEADVYRGYKMFLWNKLFRSKLFENSTRMRDDFSVGGDTLLTAGCFFKANKFAYIDKCLYHYRIRENSIVRSKDFNKRMGLNEALEEIINMLENKGYSLIAINLVKRFHTYYASQLAEFAMELSDKTALLYSQDKMHMFLDEYKFSSICHQDRLARVEKILGYAVDA